MNVLLPIGTCCDTDNQEQDTGGAIERAGTNLKTFLRLFAWFANKLFTRVLKDSGVVVALMTGSGTWRSALSKVKD